MAYSHRNSIPRLLVVDDEPANRDLLARILGRQYDVDTANNGAIALEMLEQNPYDTVLLDIMMPVLNGLDTLKTIRANAGLADLPVIIVSALSQSPEVVQAIQLGANDYVTKPLDIGIVKARVETQVMLKRLMDERRESIAALETANQMKVRMMQVASHDLKNPLNNLKMLFTIMKDSLSDNPQMRSLMNIADDSLETMLEIIQDFLSNASVDNDGIDVELGAVDTRSLLHQITEQYALAAEQKQIEVIIEDENACVHADGRRLQQVLGNLVSNAIKYSPKHSRVWIRSHIYENKWRLEVQDSGAGIPEKERRHLFTPFSKNLISTKPTAGENSTGLGLWIAAEMMRLQHGRIGMDSPNEGGCIFWLELALIPEKHYAAVS
jgi:two-component system, sensor histidine kinase and response regulator